MAFLLPTTCHHHHRHRQGPANPFITRTSLHPNSTLSCSSTHLHRLFQSSFRLMPIRLSGRCYAATPGPPLPPDSDEDSSSSSTGYEESFSRVQDRTQIFFAVLFWMSLFFWSCAWNGKDDAGRPNKGSQFRR